MSLIKPISFLQRRVVSAPAPPSGGIPKEGNILLRYEDVNTNGSGTTWTDTSGLGYTTGLLEGINSVIDSGTNSALMTNTGGSGGSRTSRLRVTTNTNINIKSMVVVFNKPGITGGTRSARNYFWDMRKASPVGNGGFFNQVDGVGGGVTELFGNNGEYYSYDELDGTLLAAQLTNSTNLVNGSGKELGGSATDQWLGPNGRSAYTTKRMWLFNFNTNKDLVFTTTAPKGLMFATNDNNTEGTTMSIFSVVGWDTYLDATDASDLVQYYKDQGVLV